MLRCKSKSKPQSRLWRSRLSSCCSQLLLTYADLISDLVLAMTLLLGNAAQLVYGIVSLGILGTSLVLQVLVVKHLGKKPWYSKDVLLTAVFFDPALEAYHDFTGVHLLVRDSFLVRSKPWRGHLRRSLNWCFS